MIKELKVYSPATVANVVCGFDILGFALQSPCDEMIIKLTNQKGIKIINNDDYNLPTEPEKNVIGAAMLAMLEELPENIGFEIVSKKIIKPGSGIGSSAASAAGCVVGANHLLNNKFSKEDLVRFAMFGEKVASGVKHADNIAPCIYGGVTLIRCIHPLDIVQISAPPMYVTIVHPQIEVKTSDAREILKKQILFKDAIKQWGNIAGLVAGLMKGDYDLISRSLVDVIVEPVRSILIPGFDKLKQQSLAAGALGGGISGSGPSVFMLSKNFDTALKVEEIMAEIYKNIGIDYHTYVSQINTTGVRIEY